MEDKEMKIVIQKFGGTSVANSELRLKAVQKIINAKRAGFQPVVVVSAIGRRGDPYATDTLITMQLKHIQIYIPVKRI